MPGNLHIGAASGKGTRTGSMAAIPSVGPGYVPAYQIAADPYFETVALRNGELRKIKFDRVTRFVEVTNFTSGSYLRVGVTENGVSNVAGGNNFYVLSGAVDPTPGHFRLHLEPTKFGPFEIRTTALFLSAAADTNIDVSVFAGLTGIPERNMYELSGSNGFIGVG